MPIDAKIFCVKTYDVTYLTYVRSHLILDFIRRS